MDPQERLAGCLEEAGYRFVSSPIGLRITGTADNPDPTFKELGKITTNAVKEMEDYAPGGVHRMAQSTLAPAGVGWDS